MKLLGLDVAKTTGWCLYEAASRGSPPRVRCGTWHLADEILVLRAAALGSLLSQFLAEEGALDYAAVEAPKERMGSSRGSRGLLSEDDVPKGHTTARAVASGNLLAGAAIGVLGSRGVPLKVVADMTWRKSFTGVGSAPAHLSREQKRRWWKSEAQTRADRLGKKYGFYVPKDDNAAEACGIAWWLAAHVEHFIALDALQARSSERRAA